MKEGDTLNYEIWKAVLHEVNEDEYAYKLTDKIISLIEKRINSIKVDHYPIGDCPECDSIMLKQFMEMLKS